ncbi:MAG: hypothetical protein JWN34_6156 [Bryobacterales bacterium]|nr:hypothetical protein [Bryobacterales bacterium]
MKLPSVKSAWNPKTAQGSSSNAGFLAPPPSRTGLGAARQGVRPQSYVLVWAVIAVFLLVAHSPIFEVPFFWDEVGQFIPASLDILNAGKWIPFTTTPNVHPPLVMGFLAGVWKVFGFSIAGTRIAMLVLAAFGVLFSFLLSIDLSRGSPGAPAIMAPVLLCISPLFFAQSMLAQLDMPAMGATSLALLLFLQNRFRASAVACVVLVMIKETGIAAPIVFAAWLLYEKRPREAAWFALPFVFLGSWLVALKLGSGHLLGNAGFTNYNLFYPLHPARLTLALLRRFYYLFVGSGHFFGTAALIMALRTMPLFQSRAWKVTASFAAFQVLLVSALGGAVLERYLLPVMPILYTAFALSFRALLPTQRRIAFGGLLVCLLIANFINPVYPFPFENNLSFVTFTELQSEAANAVFLTPGVIATTFPMTDALKRPDFGYIDRPRKVIRLEDFTAASIAPLIGKKPDVLIVYSTEWDPLHLLESAPVQWVMQKAYGYQPPLTAGRIGELLSMRIVHSWTRRGMKMSMLVRATSAAHPTTF